MADLPIIRITDTSDFTLSGADAKTKKQMYLGMRDDIMFFINGAEVIGNIHDNPELIEEEEK